MIMIEMFSIILSEHSVQRLALLAVPEQVITIAKAARMAALLHSVCVDLVHVPLGTSMPYAAKVRIQ